LETLAQIRHLALDLDGTLYLGSRRFESTLPFLSTLHKLGIGRTFFTNNSSRSTLQYVEHLGAFDIRVEQNDIFSSTLCTIEYLRTERPEIRSAFVLGTPGLRDEFARAGFPAAGEDPKGSPPDAVIVGFDTTLSYDRVCRAAYWISQGKPFIATHPDRVCPTDQPTVLVDCGAICRMLTHATGREPDAVLGKPNPRMLLGIMHRHKLKPSELAVVGDRLYTDMMMARAAGAVGILVLTGETTRDQAERADPRPSYILEDVGELARLLARSRSREPVGTT
jgi:HAD superfamily hydrolase (TIGR01450 family)